MLMSLAVGVVSLYSIWRGISYVQRLSNANDNRKFLKEMNDEAKRFQKTWDFMFGLIVVQGSSHFLRFITKQTILNRLNRSQGVMLALRWERIVNS